MAKADTGAAISAVSEDIEAMNNRVAWMNMLYKLEGRDRVDHPKRGLYTGLHKKHYSTFPGTDEN